MRRLLLLLFLFLAAPLAAQSVAPGCARAIASRVAVKPDSTRTISSVTCKNVHDTITITRTDTLRRVDTLYITKPPPDTVKPPVDSTPTKPPVDTVKPPSAGEIPTGYTLRQTWTGNPMVPSGWAVSSVSNYSLFDDPTAPLSSPVVRVRYPANHMSGNGPGRIEWNASAYQDVLVSYWFKYDPNFNGDQSSVNKHVFLFGCSNVLVYSGLRFVGNASTGSVDAIPENGAATNGFQWLAGVGGQRVSVPKTAWTRVTLEVTRSAVRLWANGTKVADRSISWNDNSCRYVKIDPTYGGNTGQTIGREGYLFFDDVRIYTR